MKVAVQYLFYIVIIISVLSTAPVQGRGGSSKKIYICQKKNMRGNSLGARVLYRNIGI